MGKYRKSMTDIAKSYGVSRQTLYTYTRKFGRIPTKEELYSVLKQDIHKSAKLKELSEKSGYSLVSLYRITNELGRIPTLAELQIRKQQRKN